MRIILYIQTHHTTPPASLPHTPGCQSILLLVIGIILLIIRLRQPLCLLTRQALRRTAARFGGAVGGGCGGVLHCCGFGCLGCGLVSAVRGGLGFVYGGRWFVEIRRNGERGVGNGGFKGEGKESAGIKMGFEK